MGEVVSADPVASKLVLKLKDATVKSIVFDGDTWVVKGGAMHSAHEYATAQPSSRFQLPVAVGQVVTAFYVPGSQDRLTVLVLDPPEVGPDAPNR